MDCKDTKTVMSEADIEKNAIIENSRLWLIEYITAFENSKGCAVVKANNAGMAERILKAEGVFNGVPHTYKITNIEEIIPSIEPMLLMEHCL